MRVGTCLVILSRKKEERGEKSTKIAVSTSLAWHSGMQRRLQLSGTFSTNGGTLWS